MTPRSEACTGGSAHDRVAKNKRLRLAKVLSAGSGHTSELPSPEPSPSSEKDGRQHSAVCAAAGSAVEMRSRLSACLGGPHEPGCAADAVEPLLDGLPCSGVRAAAFML